MHFIRLKAMPKKYVLFLYLALFLLLLNCSVARSKYSQIELTRSATSIKIPSLNGNMISVRLFKPETEGPYPVLIGIAGLDGYHLFKHFDIHTDDILNMGIMAVDFAPQGRSASQGKDNHNGMIHQDDLKALVDFLCEQKFVDKKNIGIISKSFGLTMATGALSRYPGLPIEFLIDFEGTACPGKDIRRAIKNNEPWVKKPPLSIVLKGGVIHGGNIRDDQYWDERDASRFIKNIPCPYLRIQFLNDHAQGRSKYHMMDVINAVTTYSGQWTRCNNNQPNIIYKKSDLDKYHFHTGLIRPVMLEYIKEMFFSKPWLKKGAAEQT